MTKPPGCKARQYSDQMSCADCSVTWDVNDPEPPMCGRKVSGNTALLAIKERMRETPTVSPLLMPLRPMSLRDLPSSGVPCRLYSIDWPEIPTARILGVTHYSGAKGGLTYMFYFADGTPYLEIIQYVFDDHRERRHSRTWDGGRPGYWV